MSRPDDINYEPLAAMNNVWGKAFAASFKGRYLVGWGLLLVAVGISIIASVPHYAFYAFVGVLVMVSAIVSRLKNQIWQQFASSNGWQIDIQTPEELLLPMSLNYGHSSHVSPIILAKLDVVDCDVFAYDTTTGSGKQQIAHYFTVARVALPKPLAHILLKPKKSASADVEDQFADHQKLELEGDFNDYFTLEIARGQQIDALTVLTPDVMQCLVSYAEAENIEIDAANLYFILRSDRRDPEHTKQLLTSVYELSAQILENVRLTTVLPLAPPAPSTSDTAPPHMPIEAT